MAFVKFIDDGLNGRLVARGDWTVEQAEEIDHALKKLAPDVRRLRSIDIAYDDARRIDTTGAWLLVRTKQAFETAGIPASLTGKNPDRQVLIDAVLNRQVERLPPPAAPNQLIGTLAEIGSGVRMAGKDAFGILEFFGEIVRALVNLAFHPMRLRPAAIMTHMERSGLNAVPIIFLMSFLVGGIVAQQGAFQLKAYGGEVFAVNLVAILVMRELGLLLAAIMFAGRSGSSTTAELGAMNMREEIDAMRVIGLNPVEILAVPRLAALVLALPLVTILSDLAAILGALVACWLYVGIDPPAFLAQLHSVIKPRHLFIGLVKAPFMAVIIGVIACIEGFRVKGSSESLGRHTTASVVKAIFMVIVVDGLFAVVFAALDI